LGKTRGKLPLLANPPKKPLRAQRGIKMGENFKHLVPVKETPLHEDINPNLGKILPESHSHIFCQVPRL